MKEYVNVNLILASIDWIIYHSSLMSLSCDQV